MLFARAARIRVGWIAIAAFLLGLALPAVSRVVSAGSGGPWQELCTTTGAGPIRADGRDGDPAPAGDSALFACSSCPLHANPVAPPPAAECPAQSLPLRFEAPIAAGAAPVSPHARLKLQPRAPPSLV
jgi:Protein of unknown function (DUF2946)